MNTLKVLLKTLTITIVLAASINVYGRTIYVDVNATGADNGLTWTDAFTDLSNALSSAVAGDVIWVAEGAYIPSIEFDVDGDGSQAYRDKTFLIPNGVKMYGGFQAGDLMFENRNWIENKTILSGDVDQNDTDTDGNFIAEQPSHVRGDNAFHVVVSIGANFTLDGFIITAGRAENNGLFYPPKIYGGGMYVRESVAYLANCLFQGNYAWRGGGISVDDSTVKIKQCQFYDNEALMSGGSIAGGKLIITKSEFVRNHAGDFGGAISTAICESVHATHFRQNHAGKGGGAVAANTLTFEDCDFVENFVFDPYEDNGLGGGAVYISSGPVEFTNCGFYFNKARNGGALCLYNPTNTPNAPAFVNCVLAYNYAKVNGGAMANYSAGATSFFTNCTMIDNEAADRGGAVYNHKGTTPYAYLNNPDHDFNSKTTLENCILWNNDAPEGKEVFSVRASNNTISYSIIDLHGHPAWNTSLGVDGGNNLFSDPDFDNPADPWGEDGIHSTPDDGLNLSVGSPAINTGNDGATLLSGITTDIKGEQRFRLTVDRGAYEYNPFRMPQSLAPGPPCPKCWVIKLPQLNGSFIWDTEGFMSQADDNESVLLTGKILDENDPSIEFEVYLKLKNAQDWNHWQAQSRSYITYTPEAEKTAAQTKTSWIFWELGSESYLKGIGAVSGTLRLTHAPATFKEGFQLGVGANGWDSDYGLGGSFYYQGTIDYAGKSTTFSEIGTLAVDAEFCGDCNGTTMLSDGPGNESKSAEFLVFPNPTQTELTIRSETIPTGHYTFLLYDENANLKRELKIDTTHGDVTITLNDLKPGVHAIQLLSSNGNSYHTKIMVK